MVGRGINAFASKCVYISIINLTPVDGITVRKTNSLLGSL